MSRSEKAVAATCTLLTVRPYIDRRVPFQIMSSQLNLPQVDSNPVDNNNEFNPFWNKAVT